MGVETFFHEVKAKVSPHRLFKALILEANEHSSKYNSPIKSIEVIEGEGIAPGSVTLTTFPDGFPIKYIKHRIDEVDTEKCVCKYTMFEGDVLGDKYEKVCYVHSFEPTEDGGCLIKKSSEVHTKDDDVVIGEDEVKFGNDQAVALYKGCEEYLIANPHVCA